MLMKDNYQRQQLYLQGRKWQCFLVLVRKTISISSMWDKKMIICIVIYDGCGAIIKSHHGLCYLLWCLSIFVTWICCLFNNFVKETKILKRKNLKYKNARVKILTWKETRVLPMKFVGLFGISSMVRRWSKPGKLLCKEIDWCVGNALET